MRNALMLGIGVAPTLCALELTACFSEGTTCEEAKSCASGTGGSAGTAGDQGGAGGTTGSGGATGGSTGDAPACDTSKAPSEEPCLISDSYAVFVAPTGDDAAAGTKSAPLKSISKGATLAQSTGKIVIVCDGAFDERVALTSATAGTKIYGGFQCPGATASWSYESGKRASVKPTARGAALTVDAVSGLTIEDIEFIAQPGSAAGESSVAAFIKSATSVVLRRVRLEAGNGVKGADGVLVPYTFGPQADLNGNSANGGTGGGAKVCACSAGDKSTGGLGGTAPSQGGGLGLPDLGGGQGGTPGSPTDCAAGGTGRSGNRAANSADAPGAATRGVLSASGWLPTSGANASPGGAGQGGGGGASSATGGGGGGGCGGCGGAGGPGGGGGGASIALLALDASISLDASELVTATAGAGGNGVAGQAGQTDVGFGGIQAVGGCPGGNGGAGANGGAGGGGAGGISVGIVYKGTTPDVTATLTTTGTAGQKGVGGTQGSNDGIDGVKADELLIP